MAIDRNNHCRLLAWYWGILAETHGAPVFHQCPQTMLLLFTHTNAYDFDRLNSGGRPCLGENLCQVTSRLTPAFQDLDPAVSGNANTQGGNYFVEKVLICGRY